MMSVVVHKNLAGAQGYFSEHLSQNDYYAAGEVRAGQWIGVGAERLRLGQVVREGQFNALCENRDPATNERLTQRQRVADQRRVFYDFTCSAPKSVSILAVTIGDARLVDAHQEAAQIAFRELESFAGVRIRGGTSSADRTSANLIAAAFLHTSSRALDPQLHTHFTVFNASCDPVERRWKALQAGEMYQACRYATQVYRNELARRIHELGYRTVKSENGFELEGVSAEVMRRFSKRSVERDQMVRAMEARLGRQLSKNEVSYAVHRTRSRKVQGISSDQVRAQQLAQMKPEEIKSLQSLGGIPQVPGEISAAALEHAIGHCFERRSVVVERDLWETALSYRPGSIDLEKLKRCSRQSKDLIRTRGGITTGEVLRQELSLLAQVQEGKSSMAPIHPLFQPSQGLGVDQRIAVRHVLQSGDRITGVRGLAGSGKTTMLKELAKAAKEAGYQVKFCAPTAAATDVLRKEGFTAVTLARALHEPRAATSGATVTILDEAGAVGRGYAAAHRVLGTCRVGWRHGSTRIRCSR